MGATNTTAIKSVNQRAEQGQYTMECMRWRERMRLLIKRYIHDGGSDEASDNDVYHFIYVKKIAPEPPEPPSGGRRGLARSSVFIERESVGGLFYTPTDKTVKSSDPKAKGRRVRVYRYLPSEDLRPPSGMAGSKRRTMLDDNEGL